MMRHDRRARDLDLLDAIDQLPRISIHETVWRVIRSGSDPLLCRTSSGRWGPRDLEILYTAKDPDGAVAEMYFHLSRQPVFPSKVRFTLNEIEVRTRQTLKFSSLGELETLGVDQDGYSGLLYERTQKIGDAAAFLGVDGIIAPSARWDGLNLVIFCDNLNPEDLALVSSREIDWTGWRKNPAQE